MDQAEVGIAVLVNWRNAVLLDEKAFPTAKKIVLSTSIFGARNDPVKRGSTSLLINVYGESK